MKRAISLVLLGGLMTSFAMAAGFGPTSIRITPPAPVFTEAERQSELARRRAAVADRMASDSILILFSGQPRQYAGDVDYVFRQENNLFYLTDLKQANATLIITKTGGAVKEIVYMPRPDPKQETWTGKMYSPREAATISGIKDISDAETLPAQLDGITKTSAGPTLYLLLPDGEADTDGAREFYQETAFTKLLAGRKVVNAQAIFADLRLVKSPFEIKMLQHAIDISTEAHMRAWASAGTASMEYEVQAEVEYTFRRRNADYWGYPSIVGCGPNATTLHYEESQGPVTKGQLLLMDVGAEYDHLSADVTRTFPVNGKFTRERADIYQIVYDAQEAAAKAAKPGATMTTISRAADAVLKDGLFKLGLITNKNSGQFRIWYMHGLGHWLGMNVHDVGGDSVVFKPGMTFTNEPGIYIREDALNYLPDTPEWNTFKEKVRPAFEKYKNIGVRIEDDMLITPTGVEWMTKALPRSIADIEAFMAAQTAAPVR
jgi:Xaa-Pro aminopeptidase